MTVLLEVEDLGVDVRSGEGWLRIVDGLSFELDGGQALGIVGESGSGKSLSVMSLFGLIRLSSSRFAAGSKVIFENRDMLHVRPSDLRKVRGQRVGVVFQDPMSSLNPTFSVGEQIAERLRRYKGLTRREALTEAVGLLEEVGIPNSNRKVRDYPHQFSGGMRQRVVIAIALACDPVLLIADEPTSSLDVTVQRRILDLLTRLRADRGLALILVSHDLAVVADQCDNILVMYAGQCVEYGEKDAVLTRPHHPYTAALLAASAGSSTKGNWKPIPGRVPSFSDLARVQNGCRFADRCEFVVEEECAHQAIALSISGDGSRRVRCCRVEDILKHRG